MRKKERYTVIVEADGRQVGACTDQVLGFREMRLPGLSGDRLL
ncbi:MAG: hypothetical protein ACLVJO_07620 [[Clostridium] scindens]